MKIQGHSRDGGIAKKKQNEINKKSKKLNSELSSTDRDTHASTTIEIHAPEYISIYIYIYIYP